MDEGDGVIKHKEVDESRHGIYCPMRRTDGRCIAQACAWWVDEDEERGHCAALDWGRSETDADRS